MAGNDKTFWDKLPKPLFVLAPMANVTDIAFRKIIAKYGKPDVFWTEFVSADGLDSTGKDKLLADLKFSKTEKPIVAQLFTGHPRKMYEAAKIVAKLGFDGLDINMGCPDRAVEKQGGGASLIRSKKLAGEILVAARNGIIDSGKRNIPVSIKTRLGYSSVDWDWIKHVLSLDVPVLTIHLRTRKEMSDVPAHWELMTQIIALRNEIAPNTLIIGNGDIMSVEDGLIKVKETGCDGIMIGRGIFGKPWLFENLKSLKLKLKNGAGAKLISEKTKQTADKTPAFRLKVLLEHAKLFEKTFKGIKSFDVMKKHFKAYVSGWDGAKELRIKLMDASSVRDVSKILKNLKF